MGSSSSRTLGSPISSRISCSRRRSPPERSFTSVRPFSPPKPKRSHSIPAVSSRPSPSRARPLICLDGLEHAQVAGDLGRVLGEEGELDRRAARDLARRGLQLAGEQLHQRRLARAVDADDREAVARAEAPGRVAQQHLVAVGDRDALGVEHLVAQAGAGEAQQLGPVARLGLVGDQGVGGLDPELRLGGARRRPAAQPRELLADQLLAALLARRGLPRALRAGEHVGRVAALVLVDRGVRDLPRERGDGVQEPAIVGDDEHRAAPRGEVLARASPRPRRRGGWSARRAAAARGGRAASWPARSGAARRRRAARSSCPARSGSARSRRRRAGRRARCGTSRPRATRGRRARRRAPRGSCGPGPGRRPGRASARAGRRSA